MTHVGADDTSALGKRIGENFHLRQVAALESEIEQQFQDFDSAYLKHCSWTEPADRQDLCAFTGVFSLRANADRLCPIYHRRTAYAP